MTSDRDPPLNVRPDRNAREKALVALKARGLDMTTLISAFLRAFASDPDRWLRLLADDWTPRRRGRPPRDRKP